jgi:hypothetical protein
MKYDPHLAARLTDEATARRVQLALDYDPQPPFGGIDWAHIPGPPRAMRGAIGLLVPVIAARPKRLTEPAAKPYRLLRKPSSGRTPAMVSIRRPSRHRRPANRRTAQRQRRRW